MKRDLELVRAILLALEPLPATFANHVSLKIGEAPLAFSGRTKEEIAYHIRIMTEGDLISMFPIGDDGVTIEKYTGFRWRGHEFLDDIRDDAHWRKARDVGSGSLGFMWDVVKSIAKHEIATKLGMPF